MPNRSRYQRYLLYTLVLFLYAVVPAEVRGQAFLPSHEWFVANRIKQVSIYSGKGDTASWRKMTPDTGSWYRKLQYDPRRNSISEFQRSDRGLEVRLHFGNGQTATVYDSLLQDSGIWHVRRVSSTKGGYPRVTLTYKEGVPVQKQVSTADSIYSYTWSGATWQSGSSTHRQEKIIYDEFLQPLKRWLYYDNSTQVKEKTSYSRHRNQLHIKTRYHDSRGRYLGRTAVFSDQSNGTYFHLEQKRFNRRGRAAGFPDRVRESTESSFTSGRYLHIIKVSRGVRQYEYEYRYDSAKPWDLFEYEHDRITGKTRSNILYQTGMGSFRVETDTGSYGGIQTAEMEFSKNGLPISEKIFPTPTEPLRTRYYAFDDQGRLIRLTTKLDTTLWQEERWGYRQYGNASVTVYTNSGRALSAGPLYNWPWVSSKAVTVRNAVDPFAYDTMLVYPWPSSLEVRDTRGRLWRRQYSKMPSSVGLPPAVQYHFNSRHGEPDAVLYEDGKMLLYKYAEW